MVVHPFIDSLNEEAGGKMHTHLFRPGLIGTKNGLRLPLNKCRKVIGEQSGQLSSKHPIKGKDGRKY